MTPRPVDTTGFSYFLTPPAGEEYTVTTMEAVNATKVLVAINDRLGHVSVRPVNMLELPGWISTRANALMFPHPYKLLLQSISVRVK